jgi:hypothetical protein
MSSKEIKMLQYPIVQITVLSVSRELFCAEAFATPTSDMLS